MRSPSTGSAQRRLLFGRELARLGTEMIFCVRARGRSGLEALCLQGRGHDRIALRIIAVSYTHLDVYKRQAEGHGAPA